MPDGYEMHPPGHYSPTGAGRLDDVRAQRRPIVIIERWLFAIAQANIQQNSLSAIGSAICSLAKLHYAGGRGALLSVAEQVKGRDIGSRQAEQFAGIADAVLIDVSPYDELVKRLIAGVQQAVLIAVKGPQPFKVCFGARQIANKGDFIGLVCRFV